MCRMIIEPHIPNDPDRNGRRLLPADQIMVTAKLPAPPVGKRVFPRNSTMFQASEDIPDRSPRATHEWMDEHQRIRDRCGPTFDFLKPTKAWCPPGSKSSAALPTPPLSPRSSPRRTAKRDDEINPRLLASPERPVLSAKIPLPSKKVDISKLTERMSQDVRLRKEKHEAAVKQAEALQLQHTSAVAKIHSENGEERRTLVERREMDEYFRRLVDEPLASREKKLQSLTSRLCSATPTPTKKLGKADRDAMTARLYERGLENQRQNMAKTVKKYLDDAKPKFAVMTETERKEASARLHTGQH